MKTGRIKHGGKVFRDPIHRLIRIDPQDEFILELIDTPEFQRLRRIRQLGVSWLTFHGAEHSRFVHSLGVFNFAQRIIEALRRRYAGTEVNTYLEDHAKVVKAAALLHDVGHGPFSHMIERAFEKKGQHEKKTAAIIRDSNSGIGRVLANRSIDADTVAQLIDHTSAHPLLVDIVSSQLDADRMDYLLRDSYCTGVQYGLYDAEWILNALCVGKDKSSSSESAPPWRLCLDVRRGEKAAEQFVLARAHMSDQVYFHRVTRGYECMLLSLFAEARRIQGEGGLPKSTPTLVVEFLARAGEIDPESWLRLDESQLIVAMHDWASDRDPMNANLVRWSNAFLERERLLASVTIKRLGLVQSGELWSKLEHAGLKKGVDWIPDDASFSVYKGIRYAAAVASDDEESRLESILLASGRPSEYAQPIETVSDLVRNLDQKNESVVRLFIDKRKLSTAQPILSGFKLRLDSSGEEA